MNQKKYFYCYDSPIKKILKEDYKIRTLNALAFQYCIFSFFFNIKFKFIFYFVLQEFLFFHVSTLWLLQKITEKDLRSGVQHCINVVQVYGQEKHLVLRDIDVRQVLDPLQPNEVHCDVSCLVYDISNPSSFEYIARIYIKYFAESKIPVLIVGTKGDLLEVPQNYLLQPTEFCSKYKILPPQIFSVRDNKKDLFTKLATMAAFPWVFNFFYFIFFLFLLDKNSRVKLILGVKFIGKFLFRWAIGLLKAILFFNIGERVKVWGTITFYRKSSSNFIQCFFFNFENDFFLHFL